MKKLMILILTVSVAILLVACKDDVTTGDYIILPDLNGKTRSEIELIFSDYGQEILIEEFETEVELYSEQFIMYSNYDTGDIVNKEDIVEILVYPEFSGVRTFVLLPDLDGFSESEIEDYFDEFNIVVSFSKNSDSTELNQGQFIGYGGFYVIGDMFYVTGVLSVIVYDEFIDQSMFFEPIEMEYDGPLLDPSFASINPIDPRGGSFDVELIHCSDGDTAVFDYPTDIYNLITSSAKSTRFLNMDTEETFSGGEEEWGKPGSVYTCSLLESAEEIKLQTDPGDALTGTYGRLLAWIWIKLPGEDEYFLLNYMVVKQGLAQVKYEFGAGETISYGDNTYNEWMHIAEDYAIENELGQWGILLDYYWDYITDEPDYFKWNSY